MKGEIGNLADLHVYGPTDGLPISRHPGQQL